MVTIHLVEAVEALGKPRGKSTNPAGHGDPEARSPVRVGVTAIRIVVVIESPTDGTDN